METRLQVIAQQHPCLSQAACRWFGRIHLAVAPRCNIHCRYCTRRYDCANENRPGVASRVLKPRQALAHLAREMAKEPRLRVVGIAGPGDPLANPETLATFRLVHAAHPELIKCLSTNGLYLTEALPELAVAGVSTITVTVNAVDADTGGSIYEWVCFHDQIYKGREAAALLWEQQKAGIAAAVAAGMLVKINSVLIPGLNDQHLARVAEAVASLGAHLMNIVPLIPQGQLARWPAPTPVELSQARQLNAQILPQLRHCRQCRADAIGML